MKKFYISIFTGVFLLGSFFSQAQVFNSITSNPSNFTLDDGNFWQGGVAPGNPCNGCTINIYSDVSMVQNGFSSVAAYNTAGLTFLNDVVLNGGTINVYGTTVLTINTYLELFNTMVTLGNDPTSVESIKLNDQIDLNGSASVQLANDNTSINSNDIGVRPIAGPHQEIGNPGTFEPGIYAIIPADINGYTYTQTLQPDGLGASTAQYFPAPLIPWYVLNCSPQVAGSPNTCNSGFVFGPAATTTNATFGVIFTQSTTLPVQLVQFLATKNDDGSVNLIWSTSQEQNAGYYDIERTADQQTWTKIGTVTAKGNSSITTNYSFVDRLPLSGNGYYRLKMVDLDGKFVYSKTISVTTASSAQPLVIYSNPFTDQIRLKINVAKSQNLTLTVYDMLGKTYISQSYNAQSGDNLVNLTPGAGGSGMYILSIHGDTYNQTAKLEKQ